MDGLVAPVGLVAPPDDDRPPVRPRADRSDLGPATRRRCGPHAVPRSARPCRGPPAGLRRARPARPRVPPGLRDQRPLLRVLRRGTARSGRGRLGPHEHAERIPDRSRLTPIEPTRPRSGSILQFDQPQFNHSGGGLGFGPDGLLYLGTGDGGGQGDASEGHSPGNAQDLAKLNGKVLRLDVDGKRPYAVPDGQPEDRRRTPGDLRLRVPQPVAALVGAGRRAAARRQRRRVRSLRGDRPRQRWARTTAGGSARARIASMSLSR